MILRPSIRPKPGRYGRLMCGQLRRAQRGFVINPFRFYVAPSGVVDADPYLDKVVLGLHGVGANTGTTFTDVTGQTMTAGGSPTTSTTQFKFGTTSIKLNGTGTTTAGDYLDTPTSTVYTFGTGDFTVEFWLYLNNLPGTSSVVLDGRPVGGGAVQLSLYLTPAGVLTYYTNGADRITGPTLATAAWYHVALSRSAGSTRLSVNGTLGGSAYADANSYTDTRLRFGASGSHSAPAGQYGVNGYMDDIRVTKGVGRYTGNFLMPTAAFPDVGTDPYQENVPLNLPLHTVGTTITDVKGHTCTVVGNTAIQSSVTKLGGAASFDGTLDGITVTHTSALQLSADFTIEFWCYLGSTSGNAHVMGKYAGSGTAPQAIYRDGTNVRFYSSGDGTSWNAVNGLVLGTGLSTGVWYHFAITRAGNVYTTWRDGVAISTVTSATAPMTSNQNLTIGWGASSAEAFSGYISDLRITKGVARYSGAFRAPLVAHPTTAWDLFWSSVVLGMHFDTTYACVKGQVATAFGNSQISTSSPKFGTGSLLLDGNGDYLTVPHSTDLNLSSGDWTIEAFVSFTGLTAQAITILNKDGVSGSFYPQYGLGVTPAGKLTLYLAQGNGTAGTGYTGTTTLAVNTQYHVAVVNSGGTCKGFVNGVQEWSSAKGTMGDGGRALYIGYDSGQPTAAYWPGKIDDLRITKGIARYTADFTAPIAAFPEPALYDPFRRFMSLLLKSDGVTGQTLAGDITGKAVTVAGNAQISTAQSKYAGSSWLFDGTGDYLTVPDSADLTFGAGEFTCEAWIRMSGYSPAHGGSSYALAVLNKDLAASREFTFNIMGTASSHDSLRFEGYVNNSTATTATATFSFALNTWYHVAASRVGNNLLLFVNGALISTTAFNITIQDGTQTVAIGRSGYDGTYTYYFNGHIEDARITKGKGRYTAAFTAPIRAMEEV